MKPRRWFRFSLRTFFVLLTVLGAGLGWCCWQWRVVTERSSVRSLCETHQCIFWPHALSPPGGGGMAIIVNEAPLARRLMGDRSVKSIDFPTDVPQNELRRARRVSLDL